MSDDEVDYELLDLLRQSLGLKTAVNAPPDTGVLKDSEYIYDNAVDVAIDSTGTKAAAQRLWGMMSDRGYSTKAWSEHELHPREKNGATVNFIFTMDLLNFSFFADDADEDYAVDFAGKKWTGYWSMVAALQRALAEGMYDTWRIDITSPKSWYGDSALEDDALIKVFRSDSAADIPLLETRIACLREAGEVLHEKYDDDFSNCVAEAQKSAAGLANLVVRDFASFRDECRFEGRRVRFYKRAQILVADLWAAFEGQDYGEFGDIDKITMFADYRIPQQLQALGCLKYSPPLEYHLKQKKPIESGHDWEVQLRGCSIWCVELLRREILKRDSKAQVNSVLIDFFLYDLAKESVVLSMEPLPHHRSRCMWY